MFGDDNLFNYYKVNFQLVYHKIISENDLNLKMPWERDVFINLLLAQLKEEEEKRGNK